MGLLTLGAGVDLNQPAPAELRPEATRFGSSCGPAIRSKSTFHRADTRRHHMGEEPDDFIGYTETPLERLQFLAQYDPEARAIIEGYLSEHPGMSAKEAARVTVAVAGTAWWLS